MPTTRRDRENYAGARGCAPELRVELTAMAKTRAKRAADTTEPSAAAAEPAKRRQSKRAKKAAPEPEPAVAPEPEPVLPLEPELEPIPAKEVVTEPTHVEPEPKSNIPIDDEQNEEDHIDEPTEEPRASDLYLDTVSLPAIRILILLSV